MAEVINVRFLTNKKTSDIILAEAGKEFVDLLFSFLTLPLGSVLNLLSSSDQKGKEIASITGLYDSMIKLPDLFVTADKSELLSPKVVSSYSNEALRIDHGRNSYYVCGNNRSSPFNSTISPFAPSKASFSGFRVPARSRNNRSSPFNSTISPFAPSNASFSGFGVPASSGNHYMSTKSGEMCACGQVMNCAVSFRSSSSQGSTALSPEGSSGYVKEMVTFIISNDLRIKPSSAITSISLLNHLKVRDMSELEERTASVGPNQVLALLRASLVSKTPLNDVFSPTLFCQG